MEESRARELVDRRRELESRIADLADEYRDVLSPAGIEANQWRRCVDDPAISADAKVTATERLREFDEKAWSEYLIRAWGFAAELGPIWDDGTKGSTQGACSPINQSPLHTRGLFAAASGILDPWA